MDGIIIVNLFYFDVIIFQMEDTEKSAEQAASAACIDLENILRGLDSLSNCMDQLACTYDCLSLSAASHLCSVSKHQLCQ